MGRGTVPTRRVRGGGGALGRDNGTSRLGVHSKTEVEIISLPHESQVRIRLTCLQGSYAATSDKLSL